MRDAAPHGTYKVQALDRAFAVLDLLGESDAPLGLAQVASSLQLHKSTAHRFLMVLERHRMVERTASGKFRFVISRLNQAALSKSCASSRG